MQAITDVLQPRVPQVVPQAREVPIHPPVPEVAELGNPVAQENAVRARDNYCWAWIPQRRRVEWIEPKISADRRRIGRTSPTDSTKPPQSSDSRHDPGYFAMHSMPESFNGYKRSTTIIISELMKNLPHYCRR